MDEKVETDESYKQTTMHASMICRCGVRVWYGYGKMHTTRPLFCKKCTAIETERIGRTTSLTDDELDKHLRRKIQHA
jgi:hypothetical protein